MMLDYFYGQSGELFAYFRIPKALFQDSRFRQLSTDARTLYGILLDRMSLSAKNSWVDEHGRVYIIYTVREVQESLCCAEHKAVKLFRELEQADLIERKRRGLGRPSLIYVKNFSSGLPKAQIQNCANSNSCAAESAVQVRPKSQSNKTDKNKTEKNHPFLPDETDRLTQREQLEDYFYQALEVELLLRLCPDDEDAIYQIVDLLVDTCSTKRKMLRIAGDDKPVEVVRSRLKKLNADHIRFVLGCLAENTSPVRNMKQYLLQTLRDSVKDITVITIILAFSGVFGYGIVFDNITVTIANALLGITSNSAILLLLVVVFLLICGMFMETTVIALILTPILLPVMRSIGVNEVVFGMIMMTTVTFGVMTPPVGTALYAVSDIMECPIEETFKKGWPFYLAIIGVILFMIFFPQAVLFLPNLVYGA